MRDLRLLLPPVIPAVPGRECNLYFDNLILAPTGLARLLEVTVTCDVGQQHNERFTWTPGPEDVGDHPCSLRWEDAAGTVCAAGETTVRVFPPDAGAGQAASLLIVSHSGTHLNVHPAELAALCAEEGNPSLRLVGSFAPDPALPHVRHEGYGGWRADTFLTLWGPEAWNEAGQRTRSPFLYATDGVPGLDFQRYCDEHNGGRGPDFLVLWLDGNDHFHATDETIEASCDAFEANMDRLLAEFRRVRPDTRIGIVTMLPPTATQDGFGANYGCLQTRWQYRKSQHRVVEREYARWGGREAEGLSIIPGFVNLDCVHGYPAEEVPANARTDVLVQRGSNGLHCNAGGYKQLADTIYCWLKGQLAS